MKAKSVRPSPSPEVERSRRRRRDPSTDSGDHGPDMSQAPRQLVINLPKGVNLSERQNISE